MYFKNIATTGTHDTPRMRIYTSKYHLMARTLEEIGELNNTQREHFHFQFN
jgi:hypothetical protein